MSGFDEPSDFELLLAELEKAAGQMDDENEQTRLDQKPVDLLYNQEESGATAERWRRPATQLKEPPPSLVDFRALNFDDPLSHQLTQPVDVDHGIEVGAVVDLKYEVLGPAPRVTGGWEARHVVLRQRFIVQLLARSIVDDPLMWPKFQHDIRSAGLLGHENIEFVTDLGRCEQYGAYLVKQWIDGPTFTEFLQQGGPRSVREAVEFAHTIGEAVAALHEIGIIHGRLSPESVRRVDGLDGEVWKLLDVCIPGGDERLVAPEQLRGEATGPEADQYAVALLTWQMLLGPDADLDSDASRLPDPLVEVLHTALDDQPLARWPDVDAFLGALLRAVPARPEPKVHPFDRREASRQVQQQVEAKRAPDVVERSAESMVKPADEPSASGFDRAGSRSMLISVRADGSVPLVEVEFNTGARLRREYRRNILAGGLFVPTAEDLRVSAPANVTIKFPSKNASVSVSASVVSHDQGSPDRPRGYGVAFDPASRKRIDEFVRNLGLGLGLSPRDLLVVTRELDANADIDAGGAFLLSRLHGKTTLGSARAMFSGLPFDFDDCLTRLLDGGFVAVQSVEADDDTASAGRKERSSPSPDPRTPPVTSKSRSTPAATPKPKPTATPKSVRPDPRTPPQTPAQPAAQSSTPPEPSRREKPRRDPSGLKKRPRDFASHEWSDVARVLETVEFFEEQGNFMAAGRVLESAIENAPRVAAYHHRLALQRARFDMDLAGARTSIREARSLEPDNSDYSAAERYIATLVEISAVRVAWEGDFQAEHLRWVRTEPALGLAWFEARDHGVTLVEVDYPAGTAERSRREASWTVVAENAPEFDALEHRKPVPVRSARARQARQIELARRFGGFGPHFVRKPAALARSANSTWEVRTTNGLELRRQGREPIRLSSGRAEGAVFSCDDQHLVWVERDAEGWAFYSSPISGPASLRGKFEARPEYFWSDDGYSIVLLDHKDARVQVFERRGGKPKSLVHLPGSIDLSMLKSLDDDSLFVIRRQVVGEKKWLGRWLDSRSGSLRDEFVLPDGGKGGVVRSDGKLAVVLTDGRLLVADLALGVMKTVSTVSPIPQSVGRGWSVGRPLIVAEILDGVARVLSIDVDLLCG